MLMITIKTTVIAMMIMFLYILLKKSKALKQHVTPDCPSKGRALIKNGCIMETKVRKRMRKLQ